VEDGKWLSMEVRKEEWRVQYGECGIVGCVTQDKGNEKGERE
jgi:hypothetical protein